MEFYGQGTANKATQLQTCATLQEKEDSKNRATDTKAEARETEAQSRGLRCLHGPRGPIKAQRIIQALKPNQFCPDGF